MDIHVDSITPEVLESREKFSERNDCTVIAWSNCFDAPYKDSRQWLGRYGRVERRGMLLRDVMTALRACRKAKVKFGPYSSGNRITLKKFIEKHNKGRYYVCVRKHALCVKDGKVIDYYPGLRRQVTFAARVYLEGEL